MAAYHVEHPNGNFEYRNHLGELHCEFGPALSDDNGSYWYNNGILHCTFGPAVEYSDGTGEIWINGNFLYSVPISDKVHYSATLIQNAYRSHLLHEKYKPESTEYLLAKQRFRHSQLKHSVSEHELILPQM
jgi:hypothetical protein